MDNTKKLHAVTGAFGYTGKYITRRLLATGNQVITLTGHPDRSSEFGDRITAYPFDFEHPARLASRLQGVDTLYNTYWVRFDYGKETYHNAVENTLILIKAAESAGVRKIVHVSITNPSIDSPLPYFRGKALIEGMIVDSNLDYAIVRPTVIFGHEDILINNIAYLLRKFPLFAVPGSGDYRLQPIYVEDMAEICVQESETEKSKVMDTVGPQIFTFNELVSLIQKTVGSRARIIHLPPTITLFLARVIGLGLKDVTLTRDEIRGLSSDLLVSKGKPMGKTRLEDWLIENRERIGVQYASELRRHYANA